MKTSGGHRLGLTGDEGVQGRDAVQVLPVHKCSLSSRLINDACWVSHQGLLLGNKSNLAFQLVIYALLFSIGSRSQSGWVMWVLS